MTNSFDGIMQRPSSSPLIWENFDQPDGTPINGMMCASGNSVWADGGHFSSVQNGRMVVSANAYPSLHNSASPGGSDSPISAFGGVFTIQTAGQPACLTIMGDNSDVIPLNNLTPHIEIGELGWTVKKRIGGGSFVLMALSEWIGGALIIGQKYAISLEYDYIASSCTVRLPDGNVVTLVDTVFASQPPTIGRFQIGGFASPTAACWNAMWFGKSEAETFRAAGFAASIAELRDLKSNVRFLTGSKTGPTGNSTAFATFTPAGAQSDNRITVSVTAVLADAGLPGCAMCAYDWDICLYSNGASNIQGATTCSFTHGEALGGLGLTLVPNFSLSGGVLTLAATPTLTGYVGGPIRLNYELHNRGDVSGNFKRL